jgi:hypothetical protein
MVSALSSFKRNQLEAVAYSVLAGPGRFAERRLKSLGSNRPPQDWRTEIKHLLDEDRKRGATQGKRNSKLALAFYDELPEGRGSDVGYSDFRAFCLVVALDMVRCGYKAKEVVQLIALSSDLLKTAFARANASVRTMGCTNFIFGDAMSKGSPVEQRMAASRFLLVYSVEALSKSDARDEEAGALDPELIKGDELTERLQSLVRDGIRSYFLIELTELAARTRELLNIVPRQERGHPRTPAE